MLTGVYILRILVVDDSEATRRILRLMLGSRDWTICGEAEGGRSGIEKFEKLRPDVVVLDLAMPDIDGIQTAKQMSASDPTVPIILFTMLEVEGIESYAHDAGISTIIPKTAAWNLLASIESLVSQVPRVQN
jgi:DNA-binding NarL/FixJ family response regulator